MPFSIFSKCRPFIREHSSGVICVLVVVGIFSIFFHLKGITPNKIINTILLIAGTVIILWQNAGIRNLESGIGIIAFLSILKTCEFRNRRDIFVYLLMLKLGLVGHLLSSDSLSLLLLIVVISFLIFILLSSKENLSWHIPALDKLKIYGQIFIFSIPLALILFFVFPRIPIYNPLSKNITPIASIGFSDEVHPGDFAHLLGNTTPVFRATFRKKSPKYSNMYWRGAVLNKVDGFSWIRGKQGGIRENKAAKGSIKFNYQVDFAQLKESFIFLLEKNTNLVNLSRGQIMPMGGETFKIRPFNQKISYRGQVSNVTPYNLPPKAKRRYLQLPSNISKRVKGLAEEIKQNTDSFESKVNGILQEFKNNEFVMSTNPGNLEGDRLDKFLFESRKGYCEHYASATAILLRIMNIPSRLVVGFHGGIFNPLGKYFTLRTRDAHAWVEAWNKQNGWVRIDPMSSVAPERLTLGIDALLSGETLTNKTNAKESKFKIWWKKTWFALDLIYYKLGHKFIGLDLESQKQFLKNFFVTQNTSIVLLLSLIILSIIIYLLLIFVIKNMENKDTLLDKIYQILCNKLAKKGMPTRKMYQGPEDYLMSIKDKVNNWEDIKQIFYTYMKIKYNDRNELLPHFRRSVRRMKIT